MRAEPDTLFFGDYPQDTGSTTGKLATGSMPTSVDARHPYAPPFIPGEWRVPFLGN